MMNFNKEIGTPWSSEIESQKAVEIIRLLGYKEPIDVMLFGLLIQGVPDSNGIPRDIYLHAYYCETLTPKNLNTLIKLMIKEESN